MSSALGYGNVTGHFFVWRFYETIHSHLAAVLWAISASRQRISSFRHRRTGHRNGLPGQRIRQMSRKMSGAPGCICAAGLLFLQKGYDRTMKLLSQFLKPHWKLCAITILLLIVDVSGALVISTFAAQGSPLRSTGTPSRQ